MALRRAELWSVFARRRTCGRHNCSDFALAAEPAHTRGPVGQNHPSAPRFPPTVPLWPSRLSPEIRAFLSGVRS